MKILIVSPRFPYAQGKADSMTVFHLIKYLWQRGHEVLLATYDRKDNFPEEERELLRSMCQEVTTVQLTPWQIGMRMLSNIPKDEPFQIAYYRQAAMQNKIDELIRRHQPDVVYAHLIRTAEFLKPYDHLPKVLAMQIAQTLNYRRLIEHERHMIRRVFYTEELRRVVRYEAKVIDQFDRILLISPHDRNAIVSKRERNNVFFNPHGIDVSYFSKDLALERKDHVIIMNGDFGVPTNIDAALYFYQDILPRIKAAIPEVELWLVGRNPAPSILKLAKDPTVTVTGKVPDIRPYLQSATVGIAPLRASAGLQNKVLVSLASRLPMVTTRRANEGISAPEGDVLLVADQEAGFADQVIALLQDEAERDRLGANALAFMQETWTWEFHFEKLEGMLQNLISNPESEPVNYFPLRQTQPAGG